jgi:uracil phosphoribosyltransferase
MGTTLQSEAHAGAPDVSGASPEATLEHETLQKVRSAITPHDREGPCGAQPGAPTQRALSVARAACHSAAMTPTPVPVSVVTHPLVLHKLTLLRQKDTSTSSFRALLAEVSMLMAYEVTRDLPLAYEDIETPICAMRAPRIDGKKVVLVSVLRAGNGMLDGMLRILPSARVGHVGLYRDPETLDAVEYYLRMPRELGDRDVVVIDPMLATGNSAVAAVNRVKALGPKSIKFVCLLAAPEGIQRLSSEHPGVPIFTAAIDQRLNDHGYIVPGLGDAGDRLFGTK